MVANSVIIQSFIVCLFNSLSTSIKIITAERSRYDDGGGGIGRHADR